MSESEPGFLRLSEIGNLMDGLRDPREGRDQYVTIARHPPLRGWLDRHDLDRIEYNTERYCFESQRLAIPRGQNAAGWGGRTERDRYSETHDMAYFWQYRGNLLIDRLPGKESHADETQRLKREIERLQSRIAKMQTEHVTRIHELRDAAGWSSDNSPALGGEG